MIFWISGPLGPCQSSPDRIFIEIAAGITSNRQILCQKQALDFFKIENHINLQAAASAAELQNSRNLI